MKIRLLKLLLLAKFCFLGIYLFAQTKAPSVDWQKNIGGTQIDRYNSIKATQDGGYILTGFTISTDGDIKDNHGNGDYLISKLDNRGNIQWQKCLGGSGMEYASCIQLTKDGGYIISGYSYSNDGDVSGNHGLSDCWIVKLSSTGEIQWQKCLGGSNGECAYYINNTSDGGYIIAGFTNSNNGDVNGNHGNDDCWIVKINSKGNVEWQKCLGGTQGEVANSISQTKDGGYIVSAYTTSMDGDINNNHGFQDAWIFKLDITGNLVWQKCFGGTAYEVAMSIQSTSDGGYVFIGLSNSMDGDVTNNHGAGDLWIVKINAAGDTQWNKCLGGSGEDYGFDIQQTNDGGFVAAGYSHSRDGDLIDRNIDEDGWIVKINSTGKILWQKCLGGFGEEFFYCIQKTKDNGFVLSGFSSKKIGSGANIITDQNCWVVKLISADLQNELGIPNAFSPNGDGTNDLWNLSFLSAFPQCKVEVFNRYGQLVFKSIGYNKPWDGTFNGKNVQAGTYCYIIDRSAGMQKISGWLVVLR